MFLSTISVRRPVFTTMWVVALVVLGAFGYRRLSVDLMPDVEFPYVVVASVSPCAGAANDVRGKGDGILNDLPSGVEKPQVQKFEFGAMPIMSVSVSSRIRD